MRKPKISVAIATYNEEENIGACLESVKDWVDEIVVVDGSSTDRTREIAQKYGARVIKTTNKPMFHINKNMAIDACRSDWILQLDADERVTPELKDEILSTINRQPVAYWLKRKNYFLGRWLKKGGQYPDSVIRLFKKGKARLPAKSVHEQMIVDGEVGWLKNDLIHWATPKFSRYLLRENRYAILDAADMFEKKLYINPFTAMKYLVVLPIKTFLSIFVRHKGFVDGWQGFVFAFFSGFHHIWAFSKYCRMRFSEKTIDVAKEWR
jgi:glycosyltransferase involved in cell wall biosynthesis